ncbi:MAG: right-handed parallel beta-helix repeat-containing protein [Planctomycetota bacterium]|jgi:hypothetical protein
MPTLRLTWPCPAPPARGRGRRGLEACTTLLAVVACLGPVTAAPAAEERAAAGIPGPVDEPGGEPRDEPPRSGQQHLVREPDTLPRLLEEAGAGDEFILWPGEYPNIVLRDVAGREDAPIVIRGLRPESPPRIIGGSWGIRLHGVSHVRLQDLEIIGPRIEGVEIAPGDDGRRSTNIELRTIQISDVGDRPGRHGVLVRQAEDITLERVSVEGWTGAAIEVVATRGITIEGARLRGADRGEMIGIRLRAGTRNAMITLSRILSPGVGGLVLGGRSLDSEFPSEHRADRDGLRWEVESVEMHDVTVAGGDVAMTFLGVTQLTATHLTVIDPARAAIRIGRPRDGELFGHLDTAMMSRCLFLWHADLEPVPVEFGPGGDDSGLWLEENLWWSDSTALRAERDFPGETARPQRIDVDPRLGPDLRPRNPEAESFGHRPMVLGTPGVPPRPGRRAR